MRKVKIPEVRPVVRNAIFLRIQVPGRPWLNLDGKDPDAADVLESSLDEPFESDRFLLISGSLSGDAIGKKDLAHYLQLL